MCGIMQPRPRAQPWPHVPPKASGTLAAGSRPCALPSPSPLTLPTTRFYLKPKQLANLSEPGGCVSQSASPVSLKTHHDKESTEKVTAATPQCLHSALRHWSPPGLHLGGDGDPSPRTWMLRPEQGNDPTYRCCALPNTSDDVAIYGIKMHLRAPTANPPHPHPLAPPNSCHSRPQISKRRSAEAKSSAFPGGGCFSLLGPQACPPAEALVLGRRLVRPSPEEPLTCPQASSFAPPTCSRRRLCPPCPSPWSEVAKAVGTPKPGLTPVLSAPPLPFPNAHGVSTAS